jgi:FSR family fosmidomycin resistance protein-like MFS transporter
VVGWLADVSSLAFAFKLCGWLPLLGIFVVFLPDLERKRLAAASAG